MAFVMRSGLVALAASVRAFLVANSVTAAVELGWKRRTRHDNQGPGGGNRIVISPSDDSGAGGRIVGTQQPGPRFGGGSSLATSTYAVTAIHDWERVCIASVWAADESAHDDEEKQIEAVETLIEWMMRAVHASAFVNVRFGDVRWTVPQEQSFGLEARVGFTFRHPVFAAPQEVVHPTPAPPTKNLSHTT